MSMDSSEERVWVGRRHLRKTIRRIDLAIFAVFAAGLVIAVIHEITIMASG